jgi:hypothetical protein
MRKLMRPDRAHGGPGTGQRFSLTTSMSLLSLRRSTTAFS